METREMTTQHEPGTALPWRVGAGYTYCPLPMPHTKASHTCKRVWEWMETAGFHDITSESHEPVCGNYDYEEGGVIKGADAHYIVTACNAYPALRAAAELALSALDDGAAGDDEHYYPLTRAALRTALNEGGTG